MFSPLGHRLVQATSISEEPQPPLPHWSGLHMWVQSPHAVTLHHRTVGFASTEGRHSSFEYVSVSPGASVSFLYTWYLNDASDLVQIFTWTWGWTDSILVVKDQGHVGLTMQMFRLVRVKGQKVKVTGHSLGLRDDMNIIWWPKVRKLTWAWISSWLSKVKFTVSSQYVYVICEHDILRSSRGTVFKLVQTFTLTHRWTD